MGVKTGIKQQCPNCDARVPIKDESLIGEEITCPKCKQPFVVEDPDDPAPPVVKKAKADGKAKGKERADDDDDGQEGGAGAKKAKAGVSPLMLYGGLGLAGLVVLILCVAGYYALSDKKPPAATTNPVTRPQVNPVTDPATAAAPKAEDKNNASGEIPVKVENVTNLLHPDTEFVINIRMDGADGVLANPLGKMLFDNPASSRNQRMEGRLGIPAEDVDHMLGAARYSSEWFVQIIRTVKSKTLKKKAVIAALRLHPVAGQDYYVTRENWLDGGSPFVFGGKSSQTAAAPPAPGTRPLAVYFMDSKTVIMGDVAPIKDVIKEKGIFKNRQPATAAAATPPPAGGAAKPVAPSTNYLTIAPGMKAVLDEMEAKPDYLFSVAVDVDKLSSLWNSNLQQPLKTMGVSLLKKDKFIGQAGFECTSEDEAKKFRTELNTMLQFAVLWATSQQIKVDFTQGPLQSDAGPGGGLASPGSGGGALAARPRGLQPPAGPAFPPPNQTPPSAGGSDKKGKVATARVSLTQKGKNVNLAIELDVDRDVYDRLVKKAEPLLIRVENELEMTTSHPNPHRLGSAARIFKDGKQEFPRGTVARRPAPGRANRPWPPDRKVSWMAELLPYMGYDELYTRIKLERSWQDEENLLPSVTLISEFLDPQGPRTGWYVRYPGMTYDVAATSYVGIAGIGLDAAEFPAHDAAYAKKLGIFGYDRTTKLKDIVDGLSNTIFMAQVPPAFRSPWLAGGGATIRGVPETDSIKPFVSTTYDGKKGTLVIMADGSVRFLAANMSDDVFKALCTINGGEPPVKIDKIAPVVPAPEEEPADNKAAQGDEPAKATASAAGSKKPGS